MKTGPSPNGTLGFAEILLSTLAVLVAVAVVVFPSYSGLYGATRRAEQGAAAALSTGLPRSALEQAYQVPPRLSVPARSFGSPFNSSQRS
jgi:Tfp pilus assembly protein PilE